MGLTSQLHLVLGPTFNDFVSRDERLQWRAVPNTAERGQDLRDAVVGKHGDFINIPESAVVFTIKATPNIGHQNLSPFEKTDGFPSVFKLELVSETGEIPRQQVDQRRGRAVGGFYAVCEAAVVLLRAAALRVGDAFIFLLCEWFGQVR